MDLLPGEGDYSRPPRSFGTRAIEGPNRHPKYEPSKMIHVQQARCAARTAMISLATNKPTRVKVHSHNTLIQALYCNFGYPYPSYPIIGDLDAQHTRRANICSRNTWPRGTGRILKGSGAYIEDSDSVGNSHLVAKQPSDYTDSVGNSPFAAKSSIWHYYTDLQSHDSLVQKATSGGDMGDCQNYGFRV